ncbi:MAG: OB-fold nucleic acid binding domain-containing protein, partial [Steroidobacteraceae bacterium]
MPETPASAPMPSEPSTRRRRRGDAKDRDGGEAATGRMQPIPAEQRPVTALRGVGDFLAERLHRLGVERVQDLLFVLPLRYEDRTRVHPIGSLVPGLRAAVEGEVQLTEITYRRRRQLLSRISDGSGFLTLRFFHFSAAQQASLVRGARLRCFGEVRRGPFGLEIVHPEYQRLATAAEPLEATLTPVYPSTEGLTQGRLRGLVGQALKQLEAVDGGAPRVSDWIPPELLAALELPSLGEALRYMHRPPQSASLDELAGGRHPAQRRLAFEELLAHHLALKLVKNAAQADPACPLADSAGLATRLLESLPFRLTSAQQRAWSEILADLREERPMVR